MRIMLGPELAVWCELLVVVGIGTSVAVALAELVSRRVRSAVWQRAVWQACTLTLLALVTLELTGQGAATVRLCALSLSEARRDRETAVGGLGRVPADENDMGIQSGRTASDSEVVAPVHTWWPAIVWGVGSLAILGRMVWGRAMLAVFWWRCKPLRDVATRSRVQAIANRIGLRRSIRPLTSNSLRSPAVFNWLFPVLALPSRFSDDYSAAQQEAVLAHELAHIARRDPAWQAAAMLACAVLWWQPLSWWSNRRLRAASESAADEASLLLPDGPSQLAGSLVYLAQRLADPQVATVTSMQGNGLQSDLARRVERLLSLEAGARRAPSKVRLALAHGALPIGFSLLCMLCTAWAPSRHSFVQGDTTVNVLTNAWRSSLAATAMWTALGGGPQLMADEPLRQETTQGRTENSQSTKRETSRDEDRVREVLEAIRQQVTQLRKEGKREAAERLLQVAETMTRKFREEKAPGGDRPESVPEEFKQRLSASRERAEKLIKEGKREEADKLKRVAEAVVNSQTAKLKLSAIRERAAKLDKEGKHEDADKLKRVAEAVARGLQEQGRSQRDEQSHNAKQKLSAIREQAQKLAKEGKHEAAEKLMREAESMVRESEENAERAEQSEIVKQKLRATSQQVGQLRKLGDYAAAEKLIREAYAKSREFEQRSESPRSDSAEDLRAGLRQVQRELKELREQLKQVQEQRSSNRD